MSKSFLFPVTQKTNGHNHIERLERSVSPRVTWIPSNCKIYLQAFVKAPSCYVSYDKVKVLQKLFLREKAYHLIVEVSLNSITFKGFTLNCVMLKSNITLKR